MIKRMVFNKIGFVLVVTLFALINLSMLAQAQGPEVKFDHVTIEDGLSHSFARAIVQNRQGFMWFGTNEGLNRYDGYSFKVYKPDPNNPNSPGNILVEAVYEDSKGIVWLGGPVGLDRFDPITERFTRYQPDPDDPASLSSNSVTTMVEDAQGILWVATNKGLNKFDSQTQKFTHYQHDPADLNSLSNNEIVSMLADKQGNLWLVHHFKSFATIHQVS